MSLDFKSNMYKSFDIMHVPCYIFKSQNKEISFEFSQMPLSSWIACIFIKDCHVRMSL